VFGRHCFDARKAAKDHGAIYIAHADYAKCVPGLWLKRAGKPNL